MDLNNNTTPEDYLKNIDFSKYKRCAGNYVTECIGTSKKENFRGHLCIPCYNAKQMIYEKERRKNTEEQASKLLTPIQIQKISELLTPGQMTNLAKLLKLRDENPKPTHKPKLKIIEESK
jgi:hypothetical protein